MQKKLVTINFGGFYGSFHQTQIENAIEILCSDEDGEIDSDTYNNIVSAVWRKNYEKYAREWLEAFNDRYKVALKFVKLESPRFYNFETDVIVAGFGNSDYKKLTSLVEPKALKDAILEATTEKSGYYPLYSYDGFLNKKELVLQLVIDLLLSEDNSLDYIDYEGIF